MDIRNNKKYSHRIGTKTLKFFQKDGAPAVGQKVTVRQTKHKFLFGCSEFSTLPYVNGEFSGKEKEYAEERYKKMFELFNCVTLPFYLGRFEPVKGQPDTLRAKKAAMWLRENGCTPKGHPLCWHTVTAPWLLSMSNEEILEEALKRVERDVTDFSGIIDIWDVINEVVIMPAFDKYDNGITRICKEYGRINLVRKLFAQARKANPDAVLLINDFDTSKAYDILIEGLLELGIEIDAIGIQSHMHQGYWGVEKTKEILDRFSRFKLPLHFTESTLVSGRIMPPEIGDLNDYKTESWPTTPEGEVRQAEEAVLHYTTLFEHPMVEAVTWWSFNDGLWLGAPSGLVSQDSKAKPAYNELHKLIKDRWWLEEECYTTDEKGEITVSGCFGNYAAVTEKEERPFEI